jgi:hypothetical protein
VLHFQKKYAFVCVSFNHYQGALSALNYLQQKLKGMGLLIGDPGVGKIAHYFRFSPGLM